MARDDLIQIRVLQISDVHFGSKNITGPEDPTHGSIGYPPLAKLVCDDLNEPYWDRHRWAKGELDGVEAPIILAVTGDLTQSASKSEFTKAKEFIRDINSALILGKKIGERSTFVVPGNHDVTFAENRVEYRFESYCAFYNDLFKESQDIGFRPFARAPEIGGITLVHKIPSAKTIVAEINCCQYVEKDTPDQSRGHVDLKSIASIRGQLEQLSTTENNWLKIALLHHHPILIPGFVEPGRGVDAIVNANSLLRLLREFGFHAVLHGHKHFPHVFTYDPEPAWVESSLPSLLVVAGGSLGSRELPSGTRSMNTYNFLTIKWDPTSKQARAFVVTRGLKTQADSGPLDPDQWKWTTLKEYDRVLSGHEAIPMMSKPAVTTKFPNAIDEMETVRTGRYAQCRGNMPVVEVLPSLLPGQGYEVRAWLVQHNKPGSPNPEIPITVTWSAGKMFDRKTVESLGAPTFAASFHYWGGTLLQAIMEFSDGERVSAEVYARVPSVGASPSAER